LVQHFAVLGRDADVGFEIGRRIEGQGHGREFHGFRPRSEDQ